LAARFHIRGTKATKVIEDREDDRWSEVLVFFVFFDLFVCVVFPAYNRSLTVYASVCINILLPWSPEGAPWTVRCL